MDIKIEQNVPVPSLRHLGVTKILRALAIGESVLLDSPCPAALAHRIFGKGNYRSRKEHGGIRIWRTK